MGTKVTLKRLVKESGVSKVTLKKAIASGRIKGKKDDETGYWEFDLEESIAALRATSTAHRLPAAKELGEKDGEDSLEGGDDSPDGKPKNIAEARLQFETYRAKSEELDYRKKAGELILVEDVKREFEDIAIRTQKGVLAIVARISPIVAAETDEFKISALITAELKSSLRGISDGLKLLDA